MAKLFKIIIFLLFFCFAGLFLIIRSELNSPVERAEDTLTFDVLSGESVGALATRLHSEGIIRSATFFKRYVAWKDLDRSIQAGTFTVEAPITLKRVVDALNQPSFEERTITIIPGWDVRNVAEAIAEAGVASEKEVLALLGAPASESARPQLKVDDADIILKEKPKRISFEGYLRADTYRFFVDATAEDILVRLVQEQNKLFTPEILAKIEERGRTVHEVLIMASLLQREVRTEKDKAIVSDLFWRRLDNGWPMQADSTVHYLTGKYGDVFTTAADRDSDNPWNTYKFQGLPPGPIAMPSKAAIEAAVYPEPNDYWYFLTTLDTGEVKYGKTLDEHNRNVQTYLR